MLVYDTSSKEFKKIKKAFERYSDKVQESLIHDNHSNKGTTAAKAHTQAALDKVMGKLRKVARKSLEKEAKKAAVQHSSTQNSDRIPLRSNGLR